MKVALAFLLGLIAAVASLPQVQNAEGSGSKSPQHELDVLQLLFRVYEPIPDKFERIHKFAHNYNPADHLDSFKDGGKAVTRLLSELQDGRMLQQKHWFSLFNNRQREEAIFLFEVLYNAKDWDTFVANAAYFRERVNEGEFVYAIYVAVTHHELSQHLVLPPLFEVTPHLFTNSLIIDQAYSAQMRNEDATFRMNFTGSQKNPEQRVAYFGEDIGMNTHHVSWHQEFPFWWNDYQGEHIDRKGEVFFWAHHQLTARYDAERLSNYLNPVDELSWDKPIRDGFAPHTSYKYGGEFPSRADNVPFQDVDGVIKISEMEELDRRLREAIGRGYIEDQNQVHHTLQNETGIDLLGDAVESSEYSLHSQLYGSLHNYAHVVLGRQGDPKGKYDFPPSVMEHFETATRDPAFFRLHKYINGIFKEHKDNLSPYTKEEIHCPEVQIRAVDIDKPLATKFEDFTFDITMGVDHAPDRENTDIKAVVRRIAHDPFEYTLSLLHTGSNKITVTFRVYLCPKADANGIPYTFDEARWVCLELDKFWKSLSPGQNKISRSSKESSVTTQDLPSFKALEEETQKLIDTGSEIPEEWHSFRGCGIPNRFLLPKGKVSGMEFELMIFANHEADLSPADLEEYEEFHSHSHCGVRGRPVPDKRSLGYPLDRRIPDERIFLDLPNFFRKTVTITHVPDQ